MRSLFSSPAFLFVFLLLGIVFGVSIAACIHFRREKIRFLLLGLTGIIGILLLVTVFFAVTGLPFPWASPKEAPSASEGTAVPAAGDRWYADCNEFITLRTAPDVTASEITRIPVKEEMTVLSWEGIFAQVDYQGQQGYVLGSFIQPVEGPKAIDLNWTGGSKRALPYSREGFQLYIPVTGWTKTGDSTWESDLDPAASLTVLVTTSKTMEEVRELRRSAYPNFNLAQDNQGWLSGTDAEGMHNLDIRFYSLPWGILTAAIQFPIQHWETLGYELLAMADSVVLK